MVATEALRKTPPEKPLLRLIGALVKNSHIICLALILVGWLGLLALPALDRPVGFSEKGLQAGVASPTLG